MLTLATFFLQTAVAGVLLASGLSKVRGEDHQETWAVLAARLPLRRFPVRAASRAHTAVEIATGAALLAGAWARIPALAAATLLLAAFTLLALYSACADDAVPCSCFGRSRSSLGWPHVGRNLALTCLSGAGLVCAHVVGAQLPPSLAEAGLAVSAALVVTAVAYYFDDLVDLFGPLRGAAPSPPPSRPRTGRDRSAA
ncbi:MauE/DoxX family redox-associated membrane protein [Nocardiopsis sp. NPDC050513]|uniref:MauE/DoxX family redox-associated membrane protein n=1 Tax=Nocardiopsis sp. NPDC050513 TaxID=3364338 RepID=UPI003797F9F2